jgi:hypothetical protein
MSKPPPDTPTTAPAPVITAAEADTLAAHSIEVMQALVELVQQETELVRAGRLAAAEQLAQAKADLARLYVADALALRANQSQLARIAPDRLTALRAQYSAFQALLQVNLTVLATAHAVSEGIVRGVAGELARRSTPQTYGASGQAHAPRHNAGQPLAVSRSL